ncbi:hypothetical protein [Burkholderia pseudomallei]|uniref:hypothetical protein n=1 Tax=Burkholderia pseudomallei TaxID=28450 RepID=UPI00016B218C|nr:hypothetical protein [Burkholderia pseudomallei]
MTKTELIDARNAAGAAYAAAAQAYVDTWIALHAHDLACGNKNVCALPHVLGFGEMAQALLHGEFLHDVTAINGRAAERAIAMHEQILKGLAG